MVTELKNQKDERIAARNGSSFVRTFETEMDNFKGIVKAQVLIEPKGYSAQVRLIVVANEKQYKVSQWNECSVGEEVVVSSKPFTIKDDKGAELTRYYLFAEPIQGPTQ